MAIKSVVIGLLVLLLWARSYIVGDSVIRGTEAQHIHLGSAAGAVIIGFVHDGKPTQIAAPWHREATLSPKTLLTEAGMEDTASNRLRFGFNHHRVDPPGQGLIVNIMVPHWLIFLLAMPSAILWVWRRRRRRLAQQSIRAWCPRCVREINVTGDTCPQCGGPIGFPDDRVYLTQR
jgi:hypothetical protein